MTFPPKDIGRAPLRLQQIDFKFGNARSTLTLTPPLKDGLRHVPLGSSKFRVAQLRGMVEEA
jgi:hypothetical protein